jgi:aromatic ring hydroxylase
MTKLRSVIGGGERIQMITGEEYIERLRRLRDNVYMGGQTVKRDESRLLPGVRVVQLTYDLAAKKEFQALFTATSHLSGKRINRFTHIHQNPEDLLLKQDMTRTGVQKTGFCIQRCMGIDSMNALSVVTKEMDEELNTDYHDRFLAYLKYWQENDIAGCCAQTDSKGHRRLRPHQQADKDQYLRIEKRRKDGIVVRGAKIHITMAAQAHEVLAIPTRMLTSEESDWAVAVAVPADAPGLYMINRASSPRERKHLFSPLASFGSSDSFIVFDDVFVPWDRVFMAGEQHFAGRLALLFANYHRHSYCGCKPAVSDVLMGLATLVAEYNGVSQTQHIQHKIADLIEVAELIYAAGVAAAVRSKKASSGTQIPNVIFANVGRRLAGEKIYHEHSILTDIAGGLPATLPFEEDFFAEKIGDFLNKYIVRDPTFSSEAHHRCYRTISDLICSGFGGVWQIAGVHGGGSPIMETIGILSNYDLQTRKKIAEELAGIQSK